MSPALHATRPPKRRTTPNAPDWTKAGLSALDLDGAWTDGPTLSLLDDRTLLLRMLERRPGLIGVKAVAGALIERFQDLGAVLAADPAVLRQIEGLEPAHVADLRLLRELAVRLSRAEACRRPVLSSWSALVAYVRVALSGLPREQFRTLYLDRRNILLRDELLADGSTDHAPVYPREVVRRGLELSASALILVHNHPSGDPTPSRADVEMTRRIVAAAKALDLQVHDHLVIGREGTASFRSLGLM